MPISSNTTSGTQLQGFGSLVRESDLDSTKNFNHTLLILKLVMDANGGLANVYSDLSVLGLFKGNFSKGHSDKKASSFGTRDAKGENIRGSYVGKNRRRAVSPRPLEQHIRNELHTQPVICFLQPLWHTAIREVGELTYLAADSYVFKS